MGTVSIGEYWVKWLNRVVSSKVRKSKAEVVEEGLKAIRPRIELEIADFDAAMDIVRESRR